MSQIDVAEAAKDLHGLIARARDGEEVVIVEDGQEVVRLVPITATSELPPRQLGLARGKWDFLDDIDAPIPDDVIALFHEGPLFPPKPPARNER